MSARAFAVWVAILSTAAPAALGEAEITPEKERPNRVEIAVRTPPKPTGK